MLIEGYRAFSELLRVRLGLLRVIRFVVYPVELSYVQQSRRGSVSCVLVGLSNPLELIEGRIEVMYAGIARGGHLKKNHCLAGPDWRGGGKPKVELQNPRLPAHRWLASRGPLHPEAPLALVFADPNGKGSTESKGLR
ncbi:hypothetical protein N7465_009772 [Penicillium sp. CMV-2018d]|nr:hypothetical protein N7465_009772 [Penicillium sp. CMV-2018d]